MLRYNVTLSFIAAMCFASPAISDSELRVPATVVSVYDGDTITVDAHPWPNMIIRTRVRPPNVDTPEIRGRCEEEKELAIKARDFVRSVVGETVTLVGVEIDKYGGRVDARIITEDGEDLERLLLENGLGRPYDGGRRSGWCS